MAQRRSLLVPSMKEPVMQRRSFVLATAACAVAGAARAQHAAPHDTLPAVPSSKEPYARLQGGVPHHMTPEQEAQRVTDSPAPAGPPGRWVARAALPIPRSEMAWATAAMGRMHVVGGYGEGAVNRDYHHIYDPEGRPLARWRAAAARRQPRRGGGRRRPRLCARRLR
jgi:hypothetical protein